jgi:hypothetical protein
MLRKFNLASPAKRSEMSCHVCTKVRKVQRAERGGFKNHYGNGGGTAMTVNEQELKDVRAVVVRGYTSPSLVLLTYDWPSVEAFPDFCGFIIERTPPFSSGRGRRTKCISKSYSAAVDVPTRKAYWWDTSIKSEQHGASLRYRVIPVVGPKENVRRLDPKAGQLDVLVP